MPLLTELVAFYVDRSYKYFAPTELFSDLAATGSGYFIRLQTAEKKSCSDGSRVVYLVRHDSKTSHLAPCSLPGNASFYFMSQSRGRGPGSRGIEDARRLGRVLRGQLRGVEGSHPRDPSLVQALKSVRS
jgi:hypothetical protein